MPSQIKLGEAELSADGKRVENQIQVNDQHLKPFFQDFRFYVEYPVSVSEVPRGILNIPALSTIVHFAVVVGASVECGEVDSGYLKACGEAQDYLRTSPGFESLKCTAQVFAKPVKTSPYDSARAGILFSGGSDSTSSWIKRISEDPFLYMIWGLDVLTKWPEFWEKIREKYVDELHIPNLRIVKSNTEELYFSNRLHSLGTKLTEGYRPTYSFSVNALGILAPMTYLDGVGLLQLSSTYPSRHYLNPKYPWARYRPSFIVNQFWRWGSTRCAEVDHEYSTTEKIRFFVKPYVDKGNTVFIRSCGNRKLLEQANLERLNCCVPKGTLVYSNPSVKPIESLIEGDMIQGKENSKQLVTHTFSRNYEGKMIKIKPLYFESISFTPEHEIMVAVRTRERECHKERQGYNQYHHISHTIWKNAKDIEKGDLVIIPKKVKSKPHSIDFSKYSKNKNRIIPLRGKIKINEDMAELLGWYVAEGDYNPLSSTICFSLSSKETEEARRIIELLLKVFGLKGRIWSGRAESTHSIRVLCGSRTLGRFLHDSFGKRAKEKSLPEFIMNSNRQITSAFLEAYLNGDGCKALNKGQMRRSCSSASKTLIKQIQILLMKVGVVSGYTEGISNKRESLLQGRIVKSGMAYHLYFLDQKRDRKMYLEDKQNFYIPLEKVDSFDFSGSVYNIETEENIYLLPFVVHNCYCDKCQRTIGMLSVAGVDPRKVGFPVEGIHWARTRSDIEMNNWNPAYLKYHWEEVRDAIPEVLEDHGGSRPFFNWLKDYKFK